MIKANSLLSLLFTVFSSVLFAQYENDVDKIEKILASTKIEFMGSSMVLTQESKTALLKTVKSLNTLPNYKLKIIGYAPKKGDIILKHILSKNRASQVKNILISKGINASLLTTKGIVGIKEKKKEARKTKTSFSYIDFELIKEKQKKRSKESAQSKTNITNNVLINNELATKKKKEAHTKPEKSLKEYLIARNNIAAIEQEKERVILKNQKQERARQKEIDLKSQISKSRISIFFSMNKVYFNQNSAILDNKAKDVLVKTAEFMLYYSDFKYNIMGHADKSYTEEQNTSLSQNRAITVKNFLVEQGGVDPSILFIIAKGSSEPIANNYSKRDKSLNRRVTFSIVE